MNRKEGPLMNEAQKELLRQLPDVDTLLQRSAFESLQ